MPPVWYARSATWGVASRNTLYAHHRARSWRARRGETLSLVVFEHSAVTGDRVWSALIAFHRPGAAVGSHTRRCGDEKRPRWSSLMILLLSRSNAWSARRDRREGSVGPSEGRETDTRGRRSPLASDYSPRLTDRSRAPPLSSLWPWGGQVRVWVTGVCGARCAGHRGPRWPIGSGVLG